VWAAGARSADALLQAARDAMRAFDVEPEYIALVDPLTLAPLDALAGEALLALAARVGEVRLIDNTLLAPSFVRKAVRPQPGKAMATCSV